MALDMNNLMEVIILNTKRRFFLFLVIVFFGFFLVGCDFLNSITTLDSILTTEDDTQTTQETSITTDDIVTTITANQTTATLSTSISDSTTTSVTTVPSTSVTTTTTTSLDTTSTQVTTPAEYVVEFDTQGVTEVDSISYTSGQSVRLNALEVADYIFYGWYYDSEFSGEPVTEIPAGTSGDITMYAKLFDLSDFFLNNTENYLFFPDSCLYVNNDETRIVSEDLQDLYNAFIHLGFDNLDVDYFSVNDYLTLSNIIESGNLAEIFDSKILYATISKVIIDFFDSIMGIPYYSNQGDLLIIHDAIDELDYIQKDELFTFINSLEFLDIDVASFDFRLDFFTNENIESFLNSSIWHYFVSNMAIDLENHGDISIPNYDVQANSVIISYGELDKTTVYISKPEIKALFEAMETLQITDLSTLTLDYDISLLQNENDLDIILNSAIIHLSISEKILELNDGNLLIIPKTYANLNPLIITVGSDSNSSHFIDKAEIKALTAAMNALNVNMISSFHGGISIGEISDQTVLDTLLNSTIMYATISYQIIDLSVYGILAISHYDLAGNTVVISVESSGEIIQYISQTEIENLIQAFDVMGITELSSFDASSSFGLLLLEQFNQILNSHFLYLSLSNQVLASLSDRNIEYLQTYFGLITYQDQDSQITIMQKQDLIDFHSAAIALGLNHPEISMIQIQDLVELTQSDLDIVLNSKIVKFYITPAVENLAASLSYSLTASDYEGSLTTNALTKSTIIAILDMIVE
jgi:uncharacterized repeat protein (TIGR02543 family)